RPIRASRRCRPGRRRWSWSSSLSSAAPTTPRSPAPRRTSARARSWRPSAPTRRRSIWRWPVGAIGCRPPPKEATIMSSTTRATTREPAMTHPHLERVSRGEARWQWRDPRCGWRELLEAAIADLAAAGREPAALALHHEDDATRLEVDLQPEPGPVSIELLAT